MIVKIIHTKRELYESDLIIMRNDVNIGKINVSGHIGSREGKITVEVGAQTFKMKHGKFERISKEDKPFRPYTIESNGREAGGVYVSDSAEGGLFSKYCTYRMKLDNRVYTMFPIGFGEQGAKSPIYFGDRQVAEMQTPSVIHNDLRVYTLYVANEQDLPASVLFCCSVFVIAHFHPGQKTIAGERKVVTIDKNKKLLAKYDPDFVKKVQP